jgi:tetratricopeptide (TPR) repeat protein
MSYLRRATIVWVKGQYQSAAADLQRSAALFRDAADPLQAVFAEGNLGLVYYSMARYAEAETLILAAIRAAEETNARYRLVSDLGDLSVVYIALGRMDLAYDYTDRMVKLAAELGNSAELSRGRGNRGYALLGLGRYQEALADIEYSLDLYQRQGRVEGTIVTTIDLIMYLRGTGDEEQAARLAEENYMAARREKFPHLHIVTARCLALFPPAGRQRALLEEALALAQKHERPLDEAGCLFSLSGLAGERSKRQALYREGVRLLNRMGATGWLAGKSPADPPLLPMTI